MRPYAWLGRNPTKTRLANAVPKIQQALGPKAPTNIMNISSAVGCIITSFVYSWQLTLVFIAMSPLIVGSLALMMTVVMQIEIVSTKMYEEAAAVADEVPPATHGTKKYIVVYVTIWDRA